MLLEGYTCNEMSYEMTSQLWSMGEIPVAIL